MRVLHVVSGDLWAGAEVQVWQLLRSADQLEDLDVHAVVFNPGQLAGRLVADGVPVTVLDESRQSFFALNHAIRKLCRNWRPTVIHTHRRKEHLLGALAARNCGAALVGTIHGRSEFAASGLNLRQLLLLALEKKVLALAHDRLVAVSDDLADELPGGRAHAVVIPNSIDIAAVRHAAEAFQPPALDPRGRVQIGFLGRLVPVKQVDNMLKMISLLEIERPGQFMLHIVGDGPLRSDLEDTARKLDVQGSVVFHGFHTNPLPLLASMNILLFASAHEGLPMTALEALALGVPIVSPPIGSLERLTKESGTGRVATSAAPRDLADAVLGLEFEQADQKERRSSHLPARYHIEQGLNATVRLWREMARRRTH